MNFILGGTSSETTSRETTKDLGVGTFATRATAVSCTAIGVSKSPIAKTNRKNLHIDEEVDSSLPAKRRKRTPWTKEEDDRLLELIELADARDEGISESTTALKFVDIARDLDNGRTAKQCRDRYKNFLRDGIKKGGWTDQENELIKDMYATFGARWSAMAKLLTNRTDNDIKNKWYSMKRKEDRTGVRENGWGGFTFERFPDISNDAQDSGGSYQQRNFGRKVKPV